MHLLSYKTFIQSLDVCNIKVERKKRSSFWRKSMEVDKDVDECISSLKRPYGVYSISRNDIFSEGDDKWKVIKSLYWGYPSLKTKDRKNPTKIITSLLPFLSQAKNKIVQSEEINSFKTICSTLGLPEGAYSKLLYFFKIQFQKDENCLIVDRFLVVGMRCFSDFDGVCDYYSICKQIHSLANQLDVSSEQLEYFLFFVGRHLQYQENTFRALLDLAIDK